MIRNGAGRHAVGVVLLCLTLLGVGVITVARAPQAAAAAPLAIVGDSLTYDNADELRAHLGALGWGTITINAAGGRTVFDPGPFDAFSGLGAVDAIRAQAGDTPFWIVGLGTNDLFRQDPSQATGYITAMVDRIGPGHRILWVGVHLRDSPDLAAQWNLALAEVARAHPGQLFPYDWSSVASPHPDWVLPDRIHYNSAGYSARASGVTEASRALVQAYSLATPAAAIYPQAENQAADFEPVRPRRLLDTRNGAPLGAEATMSVQVADGGASAAAIQVTTALSAGAGYVTAWACGAGRPATSMVNFFPDAPASNGAIVSLTDGWLCLWASQQTHVIVDVTGVFRPAGGLRFFPRNEPLRLADSRGRAAAEPAGTVLRVAVPAGAGGAAGAATFTVTAVDPRGRGWLTLFPCDGGLPDTSIVNYRDGETVAGTGLVPVGADGTVCLYTSAPSALIVDLIGEFTPSGAGLRYQAAQPNRVLDTRFGVGGWLGSLAPNQTIGVQPRLPSGAAAVGNLTVVQPGAGGYLTTWSGDTQRPVSSVLNVQPPVIRPNLAVIRPGGSGNFLVFSSGGQHDLLFDLTGWFAYG